MGKLIKPSKAFNLVYIRNWQITAHGSYMVSHLFLYIKFIETLILSFVYMLSVTVFVLQC